MGALTDFYTKLLTLQYYEKPKAKAEVALKAGEIERLKTFLDQLAESFDLDDAVDDRLDKIGKLVGLPRTINLVVAKKLFGFDINPNAIGFASKFDVTRSGAPFSSKSTPDYTATQLDNFDYRTLIKAKIAVNIVKAVMVGDDGNVSIQDVIQQVFNGDAVVIDNKDMTLNLGIPFGFDLERLRLIVNAGLLPSPQGVGYKIFYQADSNSFGFSNNPNSKGFASKFNSDYTGGLFARKVII
jgi:hypothetical protein